MQCINQGMFVVQIFVSSPNKYTVSLYVLASDSYMTFFNKLILKI